MRVRLRSFAKALFRGRRERADLADEIRFHLDCRAKDLEEAGVPREEARRRARVELGSAAAYVEQAREARGIRLFSELAQDLRYAARSVRRNPGFSAAVAATLALGIGANVAVFSVVNAVLLRPVGAPDADQVVVFGTAREGLPPSGGSPTRFNAWREMDDLFEDVSAYRYADMNLTGGAFPEQVRVGQVSAGYFRLFGLTVGRGRLFGPSEDLPGAGGYAVISDAFWERRFQRDTAVLGRALELGGEIHQILGVLAPGADGDAWNPVDVWIPFQIDPASMDQGHFFSVAGRIRPSVGQDLIERRLALASDAFAGKFPDIGGRLGGSRFVVRRIQTVVGGDAERPLLILTGAVAFVLLIACANVANLLLVRGVGRAREIAIRAAIGADRSRLVRQMLTENLALWLLGGALGVGLGLAGIRAVLAFDTGGLPRIGADGAAVSADWRVLLFAATVTLGTGLMFGIVPAWRAARPNLNAMLHAAGGVWQQIAGRRVDGKSVLVGAEVALALTLLVGAGLLIRTFVAMRSVDLGFEPRQALAIQLSLAGGKYQRTEAVTNLFEGSLERIRAIPGVAEAAAGCCLPTGGAPNASFTIEGREPDGAYPRANMPTVTPSYFDALGIPLVRGRFFGDHDRAGAPAVAIVSQALALRDWPNGDALGARVAIGPAAKANYLEIVGVVDDIRSPADGNPAPILYIPAAQNPDGATAYYVRQPTSWIIRTNGPPAALADRVRKELETTSGLPAVGMRSMREVVAESTRREDFNLLLMSLFAAVALLLAAVGTFGAMAYSVRQREREIGVRLALGATSGQIVRECTLRAMRPALAGLTVGVAASLGLARSLESLLFGVEPLDPAVFLAAPLALGSVALAAAWLPARRASRAAPSRALRCE
ncbi:MAG: FtsX-like permease family protein [Acidobacteria bacterium]|nr:FtsX-like permease family protein [Acidobacteriota bacterium]